MSACTNPSEVPYKETPLKTLYKTACDLLSKQEYEKAADAFDEVERQYPYARDAAQSQLKSAFCAFKAQKFGRAIATLDIFIALHPASPSIAYAYYLRAMCYYTDIFPVLRDKENAQLALQAFNEITQRFPGSEYAQDARFKRDFMIQHLACQDMCIAKEYLQNKEYIAALICFNDMIKEYPQSILMPEVLYRMVECQVTLGLFEKIHKTLDMLNENFPHTIWYRLARALVNAHVTKKVPSVISCKP